MCMFDDLIPMVNFLYAGQLGDAYMLAGLGVGTSILECFTVYILMGMNEVQETLVSQAFGAGQLKLCGTYLNRGLLINTVIFIPLVVMLLFSRQILEAIGQDSEVSRYAATYIIVNLPG
jgi:Na+-driven multidrug efflux pump